MELEKLDIEIDVFYEKFNRYPIIWGGATVFHKLAEIGQQENSYIVQYKNCEVRLDKTLKNDEIFIE